MDVASVKQFLPDDNEHIIYAWWDRETVEHILGMGEHNIDNSESCLSDDDWIQLCDRVNNSEAWSYISDAIADVWYFFKQERGE
jgi:hypothetical protein